jgi:hypothetical protein
MPTAALSIAFVQSFPQMIISLFSMFSDVNEQRLLEYHVLYIDHVCLLSYNLFFSISSNS